MFENLGEHEMAALFFIGLTAVVHFGFMFIEMCRWVWLAPRVAGLLEAEAKATKAIGFNMGLYNGFFAVGLAVTFFGFMIADPIFGFITKEHTDAIQVFILLCVVVAGIVGAITLPLGRKKFLLFQAGPAVIALAVLWFW